MTHCCCLSKDIILQRPSDAYGEINFPALQLVSQGGQAATAGLQSQREGAPGKKKESFSALDRFQLHIVISSLHTAAAQKSFPTGWSPRQLAQTAIWPTSQ